MSPQEGTARQVGADASEVLGPESSVFAQVDPVDFGSSVLSVLGRAGGHPDEFGSAWLRFGAAVAGAGPAAVARWLGSDREPPVPVDERDKRFADPAWDANPGWFALRQAYLAARRLGEDLLAAGRGDPVTDQKARLAVGLAFDALAPTNFLPDQPGRAEAGVRDRRRQRGRRVPQLPRRPREQPRHAAPGRPRTVRAGPQPRGHAGQGRVPQRADGADPVRAADREGARDAAAGQPAVDQQVLHHGPRARNGASSSGRCSTATPCSRSATATPTHRCADVTLDDYLLHGPIDRARRHPRDHRRPEDDIVGLCLGGTLTACPPPTSPRRATTASARPPCSTPCSTSASPGRSAPSPTSGTIERLEAQMARSGGSSRAPTMAGTFDVLRANDLIFSYVASNWLMGQQPPAFDILAWNADSTRLPAAMHSFYLRSLYRRTSSRRARWSSPGRCCRCPTSRATPTSWPR